MTCDYHLLMDLFVCWELQTRCLLVSPQLHETLGWTDRDGGGVVLPLDGVSPPVE